jgi:uncharacterized protein (TIGR00297 family)
MTCATGAGALLAGALLAGVLALGVSGRRGWLTRSGRLAATLIGLTVLAGTGAGGALLLVVFLASTSWLTRFRADAKSPDGREHGSGARGRNARQVMANGGVAALCSGASLLPGFEAAAAGVAGALAAAIADSWATEIGTALRGHTVLATSLRRVAPGTSGGVSMGGTLGALAGAALAGVITVATRTSWTLPCVLTERASATAGWPGTGPALSVVLIVIVAGASGMFVDSLLGASVESRRPWIDNEAINTMATVTGAAVAIWLA